MTSRGAQSGRYLFVYGTLRPGRSRWSRIADLVDEVGPARAAGTLTATPHGWPAAVFGGAGSVHGVLLAAREGRLGELLGRCDDIEAEGRLFRRVEVAVEGPDGEVDASAYEWLGPEPPPGDPVPDGRWTA